MASAVSGFLSVALGAFAAHGLKDRLDAYLLGVFRTGVEYEFYHAFALAVVGLLLLRVPMPTFRYAGWAFLIGTVIFSGSLYILALTSVRAWGAVTPVGGVAFLLGWLLLLSGLFRADF